LDLGIGKGVVCMDDDSDHGTNNTVEVISRRQFLRTSVRAAIPHVLRAVSVNAISESIVSADEMLVESKQAVGGCYTSIFRNTS
jgi:hypothetical protein